jgi:hypothetical protein
MRINILFIFIFSLLPKLGGASTEIDKILTRDSSVWIDIGMVGKEIEELGQEIRSFDSTCGNDQVITDKCVPKAKAITEKFNEINDKSCTLAAQNNQEGIVKCREMVTDALGSTLTDKKGLFDNLKNKTKFQEKAGRAGPSIAIEANNVSDIPLVGRIVEDDFKENLKVYESDPLAKIWYTNISLPGIDPQKHAYISQIRALVRKQTKAYYDWCLSLSRVDEGSGDFGQEQLSKLSQNCSAKMTAEISRCEKNSKALRCNHYRTLKTTSDAIKISQATLKKLGQNN